MEQLIYIMLRGLAIGILLSAPMGPVGVFIVQRTLSRGRWPAMLSGVGAGLSDLIYCFVAGFSMSFITDYIEAHEHSLKLIGSLIIVVFAVYLFRKNCIGTRPAGNGITQVFLKATENQMKYYENILKGCGSL